MPISRKIDGVWTGIEVPWVKHEGVWKPAINVFAKNGAWKQVYAGDAQPPAPPVISVSAAREEASMVYVEPQLQWVPPVPSRTTKRWISSKGGVPVYEYTTTIPVPGYWKVIREGYMTAGPAPRTKYFNVTVRMPQAGTPTHDPQIRRIRVLVTTNASFAPNPNSAGFYAEPETDGGNEAWSDFYFGDNGVGLDGTDFKSGRLTYLPTSKKFSPGYRDGHFLPSNTTYRFSAWSQDVAGNWSQMASNIDISTSNPQTYATGVTLLPLSVGTLTEPDIVASHVPGEAQVSATKSGYLLYGSQIKDIVPAGATFTWATIRLTRSANDGGQPSARQYTSLMRADGTTFYGAAMDNPSRPSGPISKGATVIKNFEIGDHAAFRNECVGVKLFSPEDDRLSTQAVYVSQEQDPQQGALTLAWYQ